MQFDYAPAFVDRPSSRKTGDHTELNWVYPLRGFPGGVPVDDAKRAFRSYLSFLQRTLEATKWGRIAEIASQCNSPQRATATSGQVLETFLGYVDTIDGDSAFVTLKAPSGEILKGRYSASSLAAHGISEGTRFRCSTVSINPTDVRITFKKLPSRAGTKAALERVRESLKLDLDDANFRDDY